MDYLRLHRRYLQVSDQALLFGRYVSYLRRSITRKKKKGVTRFHYDPNACYPLFLLATLFFFFSPELDSRFNTQLEILKRKRKNNQMMFKSNTVTTSINIPDTLHSLINISLVTGLHLIKIQIAFII